MPDGNIIHASGQVRIDQIDHYGIFNKEKQKYTHRLRVIKRMLPESAQIINDSEPDKVVVENQTNLFL